MQKILFFASYYSQRLVIEQNPCDIPRIHSQSTLYSSAYRKTKNQNTSPVLRIPFKRRMLTSLGREMRDYYLISL
ncbi:hypothetical protein CPSG_00379 [Coccidioides posadasii str. Silveira]|uniref:Uncharacterized protein n=1 Tax=Coccidioides posadasii (strain RMSCC 757 / Silveira) TaxID=443226 RepID=E9CRQ3_COCPS|nr:hypothetical protein CPSG_00379 [Coccidioides posadasii str. Silveira]